MPKQQFNNKNVQAAPPVREKNILFKVNTGLGYDTNNTCGALQTQQHISPQVATITSNTLAEANKRFDAQLHSYDTQSMNDYQKHYPYVFDSNLAGSKWAGVL